MTRAVELGIEFDGSPGKYDAITDVPGVEVGHCTLIQDLPDGRKVRTGVSAILPKGMGRVNSHVFSGASVLNGNGEVTGLPWVEESGILSGPLLLTNTYSVGTVRDAAIRYMVERDLPSDVLPVVGEISDEYLNDIGGQHVNPDHVYSAIESANGGPVEEGSVGGGTGAVCYEFKGGIGTASRTAVITGETFTVGAMVQANHGLRDHLRVMGEPVGRELKENRFRSSESGSIVIVLATDAPLLPHQLKRLARRSFLGLARTGSISSNGSGDFCLAISSSRDYSNAPKNIQESRWIPNNLMDRLFEATVPAVEEAVLNSMVAAQPMDGNGGHHVSAIPHDVLREVAKRRKRGI